jgi:hypothetical protein
MTPTAVGLFRESFFCGIRTAGPVVLFRRQGLFPCCGVNIHRTKLLATFPAPGSTAARPYLEGTPCLQTTRKDIVTCSIL